MPTLFARVRVPLFAGMALAALLTPLPGDALLVTSEGEPAPHLRLVRTTPAADTTVAESPAEIRLFFSEAPQMRGTSVRLADASENLVASSDAAADAEDARQVWIAPDAPLAPGRYTVHWRVIAEDGHTQRGSFSFRVSGGADAR